MQAARGVAEDELDVALVGSVVGIVADGSGVGIVLALHDLAAEALGPDAELLDGGGAEGISRGEEDAVALLLEEAGELGRGGGFAGAIDADDEDDLRLGGEGAQHEVVAREDFEDLFAGDFDHGLGRHFLLPRLERLQDGGGHRHAEIGADEGLLELVPIDRPAGEFLDEGFEETEGHRSGLLD